MTLKIEKTFEVPNTTIRLIGRIRLEHLEELKSQIAGGGSRMVLDLDEVSLVDVEVVRFLGTCEAEGVRVLRCPPYVREWISEESNEEA
jgi:anti-anti-sigma regulatory factor